LRIHIRPEGCDSGRMRILPSPVTDVGLGSLKVIWIEPTLKCNLECVHCYCNADPSAEDVLTVSDWTQVLSQAADLGCKIVQIAGGEPTLFDGLLTLVEKAREMGYRYIVLFTNATLLTENDLDDLSAYNVEVVTSFYSHLRETHDAITRTEGSFDRTVTGIRSILRRGLSLEVSMVRLPLNEGQLESAVDFLARLGIKREKIAVGPLRPVGRAAIGETGQDPYASLCGHCPPGHLVVSGDGSVYPCLLARWLTVGNVRTEKLSRILTKPDLVEFRSRVYDQ
jgi:MoaA/NifB/PqqE/SkfB family radical SAM enzyme